MSFTVMMSDNFPLGKQVNPATTPYSETPTDDTRCHLCKRYPKRFEHTANNKTYNICMRCEHHLTSFGMDDDFYWAIANVKEEDDLNLRFFSLHKERESIEKRRNSS